MLRRTPTTAVLAAAGLVAAGAASCGPAGEGALAHRAPSTSSARSTPSLLFDDEFDGGAVSASRWTVAGGPGDPSNGETQCYTPANVGVAGGGLTLSARAQPTACGTAGSHHSSTSGAVQMSSFDFLYGTVSVRARLAGGTGPWPAIWLLGHNCQQPTWLSSACTWPQAGSDEIDIAEILGGRHTSVNEQIHSVSGSPGCRAATTDTSAGWHTYELVWAPGSVTWRIDGVTTCRATQGVPSQPMFLIIDVAVGGSGGGAVDPATLPQSTAIDWVRIRP